VLPAPILNLVRSLAGTLDVADARAAAPDLDFAEVFRTYAPYAWRLVRRLGVAEADANDVCQDAFVIIHRKLAAIGGWSSVRGFVCGVCVRVASDYRRSARVRRERICAEVPEQAVGARQDADLQTQQARRQLEAVLARMDDDKREVFVLYELEELPMTEIAEVTGCPLPTAYSRLHAARQEIRAAFARLAARDASR
jgi:RNA polymerase sigma-70 factor (ECF subfamily)